MHGVAGACCSVCCVGCVLSSSFPVTAVNPFRSEGKGYGNGNGKRVFGSRHDFFPMRCVAVLSERSLKAVCEARMRKRHTRRCCGDGLARAFLAHLVSQVFGLNGGPRGRKMSVATPRTVLNKTSIVMGCEQPPNSPPPPPQLRRASLPLSFMCRYRPRFSPSNSLCLQSRGTYL